MKRPPPQSHSDQQMAFGWLEPNSKELSAKAKHFIAEVRGLPNTIFLISCGKHKSAAACKASELYTSPRFQLSVALAERLNAQVGILSAKHGLLRSDTIAEPYDLELKSLPKNERVAWTSSIAKALSATPGKYSRFIMLADEEYAYDISSALVATGAEIIDPLLGLSKQTRLTFIKSCNRFLDREDAVHSLYQQFENSAGRDLVSLRNILQKPLPTQGVYFFFDPSECTRFSTHIPRLVRIGTHGVSAGSKATLRDRLRAHLGTADGYGNHRSSVFRLHVGEALIRKNDQRMKFPNWGKGQNADSTIKHGERALEKIVSDYISKLIVMFIEVSDKATKRSARSTIETLSIGLFTEDFLPVEEPSDDWLGHFSQHEVIEKTGLWNIRDVGTKADMRIVQLIKDRIHYVSEPDSEL